MTGDMPSQHDPRQQENIRASLAHLQKCVTTLDKIREICGADSVIGRLASHAILNKPYQNGDA
jgi:hypothetical protein